MKNGKTPGNDQITVEMIKNIGEKGSKLLLKIFNKIWKEENIPKEWEIGLILPIHKKGDAMECSNYRGITLLSTLMKILEKILEGRLREEVETKLLQSQSGFRKRKSIQDHIFTIKEIINRAQARSKIVYLAFMDMEKAFDRVPRVKLWECLREKNVGEKLIRVIKCLYRETRNKIISKNAESEIFITNEGVRQGGCLSPLLFIIYMDHLIRAANSRTKSLELGYKNMEKVAISECAFADDVAIMAGNAKDLATNLKIWNEVLNKNGMKMNKSKTKIMVSADRKIDVEIKVDGERIEQVSNFQYLGVTLEETGGQSMEVNRRIEATNRMYYALSKCLINKKEISRATKMKVYKTIYRPILTFGCESWVLSVQDISKIRAVEMKYLRRVKGITKRDRIRNEAIREELKIEPIEDYIERRQLGWWGHLIRMEEDTQTRKVWETKMTGKRKKGRPKQTWDDVVKKILKKKGKEWNEAKRLARDRKTWNKFINPSEVRGIVANTTV